MAVCFQAEFVEDGILKIVLDTPNSWFNVLNATARKELRQLLDELAEEPGIRAAYVKSAKANSFLAGADLKEILALSSPEEALEISLLGQELFERWRQLPFPTLALIHGPCLGGGLEWALNFTHRIGSDTLETQIYLPEVTLGMIPGWGGTVQLPRLVGLENALRLILSGRALGARAALQMGLLDDVVPARMLEAAAIDLLKKWLKDGAWKGSGTRPAPASSGRGLLERTSLGRRFIRKRIQKTMIGGDRTLNPAPLAALHLLLDGHRRSIPERLMREARTFASLAVSDACRNLTRLSLLREQNRQGNGTGDDSLMPENVYKIGIVGAGVMGRDIAQLAAAFDHPVRLKDVDTLPLARALASARALFEAQMAHGELTPEAVLEKMDLISPTTDFSGFARTDLVVEAVPEDLVTKGEIIRQTDRRVQPSAIIVSNTSGISISELAGYCGRPERFAGMHFLPPVHQVKLVEIIRGVHTSDQTVATLYHLARRWGKLPLVVKDSPGFLVNRLQAPYLAEALMLLQEGVAIDRIDGAMREYGFSRGPFQHLDQIGPAVAVQRFQLLAGHLKNRLPQSGLLGKMLTRDLDEIENDYRFYRANDFRRGPLVDKKIYQRLQIAPRVKMSPVDIRNRLLYVMINEAAFCLEEGIVATPDMVDLATVYGLDFPPSRGGILREADAAGIRSVVRQLHYFAKTRGAYFLPSALLAEIARSDKGIYDYWEAHSKAVPGTVNLII